MSFTEGRVSVIDENRLSQFAREVLRTTSVGLLRELLLEENNCSLTIWIEIGTLPPNTVTLFEHSAGIYSVSEDIGSVERLLKNLRPDLNDNAILLKLLDFVLANGLAIVLSTKSFGWNRKYESVWHEPRLSTPGFELFCNDFCSGQFLKFLITKDYDIVIEVLGPGKKISIR